MELGEILGYTAAGLVLATFTMRTMIPLRVVGIASNVAFIAYGYMADLIPVLLLHGALLPLNVYRLLEMHRMVREIADAASGANTLAWLQPFMSSVSTKAGETLFRKGDHADAMYLITRGCVRLEEFDVEIEAGEVVGEIGLFSPDGRRVATATCVEECKLQRVTRDKVRELVFQNPRFAFHLIGVVTSRLVDDLRIIEERSAAKVRPV
jgi:CRP/FNR family transcriptional regulator, cyclic AMP receptor protein